MYMLHKENKGPNAFEPLRLRLDMCINSDSICSIDLQRFAVVMCIKPWPGTCDPFGVACPEPWLRIDLIRFDWIRFNSFRLVVCMKPWPGTAAPFGDTCPEPWLCTDLLRFDWIRWNSLLCTTKHTPGQALLLGMPVPNHGFARL